MIFLSAISCDLYSLSATLRSTSRTRQNQWKLRYRRSSISKRRSSESQILRYRSTKLRYPYMNFSFDIKVILDIGLRRYRSFLRYRYRSLLRYRSIFNIEVLRYRRLNTSISKFCEIRDFDIDVNGLRYRSPYRRHGRYRRHTRSLPNQISGFSPISCPIWSQYCKKYRNIRISGP